VRDVFTASLHTGNPSLISFSAARRAPAPAVVATAGNSFQSDRGNEKSFHGHRKRTLARGISRGLHLFSDFSTCAKTRMSFAHDLADVRLAVAPLLSAPRGSRGACWTSSIPCGVSGMPSKSDPMPTRVDPSDLHDVIDVVDDHRVRIFGSGSAAISFFTAS